MRQGPSRSSQLVSALLRRFQKSNIVGPGPGLQSSLFVLGIYSCMLRQACLLKHSQIRTVSFVSQGPFVSIFRSFWSIVRSPGSRGSPGRSSGRPSEKQRNLVVGLRIGPSCFILVNFLLFQFLDMRNSKPLEKYFALWKKTESGKGLNNPRNVAYKRRVICARVSKHYLFNHVQLSDILRHSQTFSDIRTHSQTFSDILRSLVFPIFFQIVE